MTRQIFAAEINFEDAPLHVRESFNGTEKNIKRILTALKPVVEEVYALATHHRFTLYTVHENIVPLTNFFHLEHNLKGYVQFYYNTGESVTHLFAAASGLLSTIKGEPQILTEINKSYQWAASCACLGITLDNLLCKATEIGKAVRTATAIDKFCESVVETGIGLLYERLEDLHKKKILIVGTGKIARLALEYLCKEGIRNIAITGHHHRRALELAKQFHVKVFDIEKAGDCFLHSDVVIGASYEEVKINCPAQEKKRVPHPQDSKNRFILDFGIPPNFDPGLSEAFAAELFNLDDLRHLQQSPLESFGGLELAWSMVMKESNEFVHLLQQLHHSPVLTAYLTRLFTLKNSGLNVKPKRTLKNILLFKKSANATGLSSGNDYKNAKAHINNYRPENGDEIVRHIKTLRNFKFYLSDN
jgi:glutamyl-tRNA reductase